jgi:hypothetical protein
MLKRFSRTAIGFRVHLPLHHRREYPPRRCYLYETQAIFTCCHLMPSPSTIAPPLRVSAPRTASPWLSSASDVLLSDLASIHHRTTSERVVPRNRVSAVSKRLSDTTIASRVHLTPHRRGEYGSPKSRLRGFQVSLVCHHRLSSPSNTAQPLRLSVLNYRVSVALRRLSRTAIGSRVQPSLHHR